MSKKQLRDYGNVSLKTEDIDGQLDFAIIFGRSGPVHVEIGSGKGTFLINQAVSHLQENYLGIERANKYYRYAVDRVGRCGLANVRIIRTDAAKFIAENIGDETVNCFHIYFSDPWPKKKHHKRRFFDEHNARELIRCLVKNGTINIATDHEDYFKQIQRVIDELIKCSLAEPVDYQKPAGVQGQEVAGTNYERKYIRDGRAIYTTAAGKI